MDHRLALIGFGTVGQGLAEILLARAREDQAAGRPALRVVAVSDLLKGSVYDPQGLDLAQLLDLARHARPLGDYAAPGEVTRGWDSLTTIRRCNADTMVEVSWTDVKTGQPAIDHCYAAFAAGKHAVLTNKGPIALAYHDLQQAADAAGRLLRFEGTVMSGTPALRLARQALAGCTIHEIQGILNGTTNFILTRMEAGMLYADALAEAQRLGYAEADPTADVEGFDALAKVVILANAVMGGQVNLAGVPRQGITQVTAADIKAAAAAGERYKLIGRVSRRPDGRIEAGVAPQRLPLSHPLAAVSGVTNAITFSTDLLGDVTLVGPGAGRRETGFAVLSDVLEIQRHHQS